MQYSFLILSSLFTPGYLWQDTKTPLSQLAEGYFLNRFAGWWCIQRRELLPHTQLTQLTAQGKHLSSTFDTAQIRGRMHGRPILIRGIEDGATIRMLVHNEVHIWLYSYGNLSICLDLKLTAWLYTWSLTQ